MKHEDVSAFLCESREILGQKNETRGLICSSVLGLLDVILLLSGHHHGDGHMTGRNMLTITTQ